VDYERFRGSLVKLETFQPVAGNRHWQGRLTAASGGKITLDRSAIQAKGKAKGKSKGAAAAADALVDIELANIEKANLIPEL
jgi:ribosome maturation factor RimP